MRQALRRRQSQPLQPPQSTRYTYTDRLMDWSSFSLALATDASRIPGCPPSPPATIYGFACALGLLDQKLHESRHVAPAGEQAPVAFPARRRR